jgi:inhibitor of KinA sporulation pathway (predicted exonuclease)
MKIKDNFISIDLELNQKDPAKIIELGYTIGNIYTGEILESKGLIVNPNEELLPFIINLTSITQAMVDNGMTLAEAYSIMKADFTKYDCAIMPIVWGNGDIRAIKKELNPSNDDWIFGYRELDLKTYRQFQQIPKRDSLQGGLAKSMAKDGLLFKGTKHRAICDSLNTFLYARKLMGIK